MNAAKPNICEFSEFCQICQSQCTSSFAESLHSIQDDLSKISEAIPDSDDIRVFKARMEYTHGEYLKFVKPKIVCLIQSVYR